MGKNFRMGGRGGGRISIKNKEREKKALSVDPWQSAEIDRNSKPDSSFGPDGVRFRESWLYGVPEALPYGHLC